MGRASQRKGASGERELAALLREYGYNIERGGSCSFGEVPDLSGIPGIHIEVKRRENVDLSAALAQASTDAAYFGGLPAVFHRGNRQKWRVTMTLDSWITLYKWALSGDFGRSEPPEGLGNTE